MSISNEFNQIKSIFEETLQYYNYNKMTINELLTDDFITGLLELKQQEPENNELISMLRNFSNEQNLTSLTRLDIELRKELSQDGYVSRVLKFINSSWMNVDFEENTLYTMRNARADDVDNIKVGISITAGFLNFLSKIGGTGQKIIASDITVPLEVARKLHNRFEDEFDFADQFENDLRQVAFGMGQNFSTASDAKSPLIIDLDGDGVETISTGNGVYFDHDGNGFAENTGWAGKDDGILVRDLDGNGLIDKGTELFGNNSVLASGEKAANGFEALKDLDSNADGVFNSADSAWNEVKVWKDANQNGLVDSGELLTLEQSGVGGINLGYTDSNTTDANGNTHGETGTIIKSDGTTGTITDVWFDANMSNTVDRTDVVIDGIKSNKYDLMIAV